MSVHKRMLEVTNTGPTDESESEGGKCVLCMIDVASWALARLWAPRLLRRVQETPAVAEIKTCPVCRTAHHGNDHGYLKTFSSGIL